MAILNLFNRIFRYNTKQGALSEQKSEELSDKDKKFIEIIQKLSQEKPLASVSYYDRNDTYYYDIENSSFGPVMLSYSEDVFDEDDCPFVEIQVPKLQYAHYAFDRGMFDRIAFSKGKRFIKHDLRKQRSTLTPHDMLSKSVNFMKSTEKQIAR